MKSFYYSKIYNVCLKILNVCDAKKKRCKIEVKQNKNLEKKTKKSEMFKYQWKWKWNEKIRILNLMHIGIGQKQIINIPAVECWERKMKEKERINGCEIFEVSRSN